MRGDLDSAYAMAFLTGILGRCMIGKEDGTMWDKRAVR